MTILVTGGCGFIGSNFIRHMMRHYDYEIVNLDALTYCGKLENLSDVDEDARYVFIQGDIANRGMVKDVISTYRPDAIVNFAAASHVDNSIHDASDFIQTNIVGVYNLLNCAAGARIIQISTDEVMGHLKEGEPEFTEESPLKPRNPYSATKASAECLCMSYFHTHNAPVLITRASNNYGPYQFTEKFIPLFITNCLKGKDLPLYGSGENIRDWLHVDDHCRAIDLILHKGREGEIYNIGGGCERRNVEIAHMICDLTGTPYDQIKPVRDRKGHDWRYSVCYDKIRDELGWEPGEEIDKRLGEVVDWYKQNEWWW